MNARSPYLASTLGHVLVLVLLLWLTSLQRPALFVPGVRIIALPSGGGAGTRAAEVKPPPAAAAPPAARAEEVPPPRQPKEKRPPEKKAPPPRRQPEPVAREGTKPAAETGMVSKSKGAPPEAARPRPGAAAAGTGAPGSGGPGSGPGSGPGLGGVGIEAEGEGGAGAWYLALLRDRIASVWLPPPAIGRSGEASASVHFYLRRAGGAPEKVEVRESSQVSYFDRAAVRAILDAAPLPPLPQEFGSDPTGFTLLFKQPY